MRNISLLFVLTSLLVTAATAQEETNAGALTKDLKVVARNPQKVTNKTGILASSATSTDGQLTVTVSSADLTEGEFLKVTASAKKDGFLRIFYQSSAGDIAQIFPNSFQTSNEVAGGDDVTIPGAEANFGFQVQKPFGAEALLVMHTENQLLDEAGLNQASGIFKTFKNVEELEESLTKAIGVVPIAVSHITLAMRTSAK